MTTRREDAGTETADGCAAFAAALPDYLDGALTGEADGSARAHIVSCDSCRTLVRDLERIRVRAAALPVQRPSTDLWAGIEARIQAPLRLEEHPEGRRAPAARGVGRRWLTQPWARAAALVIATAGVTIVATRQWTAVPVVGPTQAPVRVATGQPVVPTPKPPLVTPVIGQPGSVVTSVKNDGRSARPAAPTSEFIYDQQITTLHRIVESRRRQMNPKTVAIIEKNLRVIDAAIAESKAALAKDPANGFLAQQLDATLSTKLDLLRTVAMLPSRT
jgi:hypothetical protein